MKPGQVCGTCACYAGMAQECRAKSPVILIANTPNGPMPVGMFPPTRAENWCGEWRAEEPKLAVA